MASVGRRPWQTPPGHPKLQVRNQREWRNGRREKPSLLQYRAGRGCRESTGAHQDDISMKAFTLTQLELAREKRGEERGEGFAKVCSMSTQPALFEIPLASEGMSKGSASRSPTKINRLPSATDMGSRWSVRASFSGSSSANKYTPKGRTSPKAGIAKEGRAKGSPRKPATPTP